MFRKVRCKISLRYFCLLPCGTWEFKSFTLSSVCENVASGSGHSQTDEECVTAQTGGSEKFINMKGACTIQLIVTVNLSIVIGETVTLLAGGIAYITVMVYNGIWETNVQHKNNPFKDFLISVVCSGIFTVVLVACYTRLGAKMSQIVHISIPFFIGIAVLGFAVLRILAHCNFDRKEKNEIIRESEQANEIQPVNVFTANGNMQADMIWRH